MDAHQSDPSTDNEDAYELTIHDEQYAAVDDSTRL